MESNLGKAITVMEKDVLEKVTLAKNTPGGKHSSLAMAEYIGVMLENIREAKQIRGTPVTSDNETEGDRNPPAEK